MTTELIWQHLDTPGWEHVRVMNDHPGWTVFDSILVREHEGQVLRGGYTLVTDKQWRTLELRLMMESSPGSMEGVHLLSEGDGRWADADDQHIPELDGCLDIDFEWSPLTQSLPINRLALGQADQHIIRTVHITLPDLALHVVEQKYTRLDHSTIRLSDAQGDHSATMSVDHEGFVVKFEDVFLRTRP